MHETEKIKTTALVALIVTAFTIAIIQLPPVSGADNWTLVNDARSLKAYPDLREYVWQKNASMPPNGVYDKIGLHRLVKTGTTPKGVMFILPGLQSSGEEIISNPPGDNLTKYENYSQAIYWANRGFDVYGIDYRHHFVPNTLNSSQLSFMLSWGWDQYVNDIKEAVDKAKEVSGAQRIFMAGMSQGGEAAMNYAAKYWKDDLRGIILLDADSSGKRQQCRSKTWKRNQYLQSNHNNSNL